MGAVLALMLVVFAAGLALGIVLGWLTAAGRKQREILEKERELSGFKIEIARLSHALSVAEEEADRRGKEIENLRDAARGLEVELASLRSQAEAERKSWEDKLLMLEQARSRLQEVFSALSREALHQNSRLFFDMAKEALERYLEGARKTVEGQSKEVEGIVSPLRDSLEKLQGLLRDIESARKQEMGMLSEQLRGLAATHQELQRETGKLAMALKTPSVRGRWGELQLRRVAELAGMVEHCDFREQVETNTEEGRMRPDMIVHLPGRKNIVVDAKASINAYLESLEASSEEEREAKLIEHAKHIRNRVSELGSKKYWERWPSPDFVVLFLPGENFFSAALEKDPELISYAAENRVVLATPTTLIALLRAVAFGWRQEAMTKNAEKVREMGLELYKRLQKMVNHFARMREGLRQAVDSFNDAMGSFENRVLVQARRFREMGLDAQDDIQEVEAIDVQIRSFGTKD